jgi:ABC-2 type transport system ATP-binding protein
VRVLGKDPARFTAADRRRIGYQAQAPVLFPHLSLWGNLTFVASLYGVPLWGRRRRLRRLLELVDLLPQRRTLLAHASGGMQRRLALAATLVHEPELVFLDEPTAGVDPILRTRFWNRFREQRDQGTTIVVSTQYVGEAAQCDRVAVMADGRLVACDTPTGLARQAYGGDVLAVHLAGADQRAVRQTVDSLPVVREVTPRGGDRFMVVVRDATIDSEAVSWSLERAGLGVPDVTVPVPDFDEVFVRLVRAHRGQVDAEEGRR